MPQLQICAFGAYDADHRGSGDGFALDAMEEITIKVPAPFAGVNDLGFTAQYRQAGSTSPTADIPLLIEGPTAAMARLAERLALLKAGPLSQAGQPPAYSWTDPIALSDEVIVIAFRDESLRGGLLSDDARASYNYVFNLVRPVAFPFLQDCARLAGLRLSDRIVIQVKSANGQTADFALRPEEIVDPNGEIVLFGL